MDVNVTELPTSVNEAAKMLQPWLGEPGMLTDVFVQVEALAPSKRAASVARRLFREAFQQIKGGATNREKRGG